MYFSLRDGEWDDFLAAELVPGDVVFCDVGDRVPADIRFFEVNAADSFETLLSSVLLLLYITTIICIL